MQNINSKNTQEERSTLKQYNQKSKFYSAINSNFDMKSDLSYIHPNSFDEYSRPPPPSKVLKARIFNRVPKHLKPQTLERKKKTIERCNTETPKRSKKKEKVLPRKQSVRSSVNSFSSYKSTSKASYSSKCKNYSKCTESSLSVFDITKMPNWKKELNNFIVSVFQHRILCPQLNEEVNKIGGSRILNEYKKLTNKRN